MLEMLKKLEKSAYGFLMASFRKSCCANYCSGRPSTTTTTVIGNHIRFRRRRDDLSQVPDLEKFSGVSSDDEHDLAF
jgi:hypothetical protein